MKKPTKKKYEIKITRKINRKLQAGENKDINLVYWINAYDAQEATFSAMNDFRDEFYPDIIMAATTKEL